MKTETVYQLHLSLPFMSNRGVRLRELQPSEITEVEDYAATLVGKEGNVITFRNAVVEQGLKRMIIEISEPVPSAPAAKPGQPEAPSPLSDPKVKWAKVTLQDLSQPSSEWFLDKVFTTKDMAALGRYYRQINELDQGEVELLAGKVLPVPTAASQQPTGNSVRPTGT